MRKIFYLVLVLAFASRAQAAAPTELQTEFKSQSPYSEADFTYLALDVYRIALWTDEARWKPDSRYALSITYHMNFSSDELVERTCDEMQRHQADGKILCQKLKSELALAMPSVKKGDRISALRTEDAKARFYKNGSLTAEMDNQPFVDTFFAVWLGENTSEPKLRQKLLK